MFCEYKCVCIRTNELAEFGLGEIRSQLAQHCKRVTYVRQRMLIHELEISALTYVCTCVGGVASDTVSPF